MKSLYIIRHAKSSWGDFTLPDIERPLNERGKKDAPIMADRLLKLNVEINVFISSPAIRALKTCKIFCKEYNKAEGSILVIDELYNASVEVFYKIAKAIPNEYESAAIFSHNPGITDFVNSLGTEVRVDHMPTCAIYGVEFDSDTWSNFKDSEKKYLLFQYPKLF
jgi:phosphohistidine phosphatase